MRPCPWRILESALIRNGRVRELGDWTRCAHVCGNAGAHVDQMNFLRATRDDRISGIGKALVEEGNTIEANRERLPRNDRSGVDS